MKKILTVLVSALLLCGFSPLPEGGIDATPAFNAAVAEVCASADTRTLKLPAGLFTFSTVPNVINCALNLVGEGKGGTSLRRAYNGNGFLMWGRGTDQSGGSLRDLTIEAATGTNGGIAVLISATPDTDGTVNSFNRHGFIIDNVQVGRQAVSGTSWDFGLYLDGSANPDGNPNSVPGIRATYVSRSSFGGARTSSVYLNKARGPDLHVECYTPLNGSQASIIMAYATQSVRVETRNCVLINDGTSTP